MVLDEWRRWWDLLPNVKGFILFRTPESETTFLLSRLYVFISSRIQDATAETRVNNYHCTNSARIWYVPPAAVVRRRPQSPAVGRSAAIQDSKFGGYTTMWPGTVPWSWFHSALSCVFVNKRWIRIVLSLCVLIYHSIRNSILIPSWNEWRHAKDHLFLLQCSAQRTAGWNII